MKNRMFIAAACVLLGATAFLVRPLVAQPDLPHSPTGKKPAGDLVVPPGLYSAFVFAFHADGGSIRVTLKSATGELIVVVRGNETVTIPMAGTWALSQQATISFPNIGGSLFVTGITPSGPVNFDGAKK